MNLNSNQLTSLTIISNSFWKLKMADVCITSKMADVCIKSNMADVCFNPRWSMFI